MADKKVKMRDDKKIYGSGSSKFLAKGKEYIVHSNLAETLVNNGSAVYNKSDVGKKVVYKVDSQDDDLLNDDLLNDEPVDAKKK